VRYGNGRIFEFSAHIAGANSGSKKVLFSDIAKILTNLICSLFSVRRQLTHLREDKDRVFGSAYILIFLEDRRKMAKESFKLRKASYIKKILC